MLPVALADFVDRDDVRIVELRDRLRLRVKTRDIARARELPRADRLHRDEPLQTHLPRTPHHAHPAARDFLDQFVIAEPPRDGRFIRKTERRATQARLAKPAEQRR